MHSERNWQHGGLFECVGLGLADSVHYSWSIGIADAVEFGNGLCHEHTDRERDADAVGHGVRYA